MFDFEDRAMFEPEPANDEAHAALELDEAFATAIRYSDAKVAWLNAVAVIGALLFAVFVVSII